MSVIITHPVYEWTATTAADANRYLRAVQDLVDAHLASLGPYTANRPSRQHGVPLKLTIHLDLGNTVARINSPTPEDLTDDD